MKSITVKDLVEKFKLEVLSGADGIDSEIISDDIHRPGLELSGYLKFFPHERVQILGKQEITYLHSLDELKREKRIEKIVKKNPPCFIITRGQEHLDLFKKHCENEQVPLLRTTEKTTNFMSKLNSYLERSLAKEQTVHAVCLDVFGIGIIIRGESGIGKSELALSLIERGHRLISDDIVILKKLNAETLVGTHNQNNKHFLALRGVGMVDVLRVYGTGAYQEETNVQLDILIAPWENGKSYDSIGLERNKTTYLDVTLDHMDIPIRPGRDLAALVEVAVKNWRLREEGYEALDEFKRRTSEEF